MLRFGVSLVQAALIEPAVKGTLNVLKASLEAKVKRVVSVSSVVAVDMNPTWPEGQVMDETCWSDKEYCRKIEVSVYEFYMVQNSVLMIVAICIDTKFL